MEAALQTVTLRTMPRMRDLETQAKALMLAIVEESRSARVYTLEEPDDKWVELLQLVQQPVLNILRYVFWIANPEDQDDMFQEVMLRLYRFQLRYDVSRPFLPWLYEIARNVKRDWSANSRLPIESSEEPQTSHNPTLRLIGEQVLAKLSEEDRQVLWLSYYEEFSNAEISEYLNIPLSTTKYYLRRAKKRARDLLTKHSRAGKHNET